MQNTTNCINRTHEYSHKTVQLFKPVFLNFIHIDNHRKRNQHDHIKRNFTCNRNILKHNLTENRIHIQPDCRKHTCISQINNIHRTFIQNSINCAEKNCQNAYQKNNRSYNNLAKIQADQEFPYTKFTAHIGLIQNTIAGCHFKPQDFSGIRRCNRYQKITFRTYLPEPSFSHSRILINQFSIQIGTKILTTKT